MLATMLEGICQSPFFGHYGFSIMLAFLAIWRCWHSGVASLKTKFIGKYMVS
jgi:hypothetical protein